MLQYEDVQAWHKRVRRENIMQIIGDDPSLSALEAMERLDSWMRKYQRHGRAMQDGMALCENIVHRTEVNKEADPAWADLARRLSMALIEKHQQPDGSFLEYDWNSWVEREWMWRTTPWGMCFVGHALMDGYDALLPLLDEEETRWWQERLRRMGNWIHGNPVVGAFVFNGTMGICRTLWRVGDALDSADWKKWALDAGRQLMARDMDKDGWIFGEGGGCSGHYQQIGIQMIADIARESGDPGFELRAREFLPSFYDFVCGRAGWPGNFGTRTSDCALNRMGKRYVVSMAAMGEGLAADLLHKFAQADWSSNLTEWEAALETKREPREKPALRTFKSIDVSLIRGGGFTASLADYEKSQWTRGFASLFHEDCDWPIFITLRSLNTQVEKAKLRLDDLSEFAGFPAVSVQKGEQLFRSHQAIDKIKLDDGRAQWTESLRDDEGNSGGKAHFDLALGEEGLKLIGKLEKVAGSCVLDFHLYKPADVMYGFWPGDAIREMDNNGLPSHGCDYGDVEFHPAELETFAMQIGPNVWVFEFDHLDPEVQMTAGLIKMQGLHTGNTGGPRLRLQYPETEKNPQFALSLHLLEKLQF